MPISPERFQTHLQSWANRAGRPYWPKFLFHYAHVTAAAQALSDGQLICRAQQEVLIHDVADEIAIVTNPQALEYVRLYFRPLTNFHLSTEGIKFRGDPYRRPRHMTIPIVLVLNAERILTSPGVGFSGRKLAHVGQEALFDDRGFDSIQFQDVYHLGPPGGRMVEIQDRRMAEVIVPGTLNLNDCLQHIVCRTIYDEQTLRHFASNADPRLLERIRVSTKLTDLYFCRDTFIHMLEFIDDTVKLKLFQGRNYTRGKQVRCEISQSVDGRVVAGADFEDEIDNNGVSIGPFARTDHSLWRINIEEALAFEGRLPSQSSVLVSG